MTNTQPITTVGKTLLGIEPSNPAFDTLAGFALRDNARRAHLIVSKVLGKHIPVTPSVMLDACARLGDNVKALVEDLNPFEDMLADALVMGYCETATGLGHGVAQAINVSYLHTTRKEHPSIPVQARFEEEHSHAVAHLIQPDDTVSLTGSGPLILVDDELTTGKTALNTLAALHAEFPRPYYVIATLLDARTPDAITTFDQYAKDLGITVFVTALTSNYLMLPDDILDRVGPARTALAAPAPAPTEAAAGEIVAHAMTWIDGVPTTARHGVTPAMTAHMDSQAMAQALRLSLRMKSGESILVLGTEELIHSATLIAAHVEKMLPGATVVTQSTTRSPVHPANMDGYAIRRTVEFTCPDDPTRISRVQNLFNPEFDGTPTEWANQTHDHIVVVVDANLNATQPLLDALKPYGNTIHHLPVPLARPAMRAAAVA